MAFNDAKRYSDKLRIKNFGLYGQGDPHARRDQCWSPWCDVFVEDMGDDNRCHTPECDARLRAEAVKRGHMFKVGDVLWGSVEGLLVKPDNLPPTPHTQEILKRRGLDGTPLPMCACGKNPKAPRKNTCHKCYQAQQLAEHYERKQKRRNRHKGNTPGFNRINGLEGLRDKLK